ncbi:MAG: hypothetical protein KNU04_gp52 [crAssphage sp. isolate ctbg_1]|uniref:D,D-heptose 1,7-bisphosphate phosphatase n=1 Tax=crAssphage sp. isolate ctbg_1 TaxID=2989854 RepID=A0A345MT56_9CAUD|nr:MAG: hypothetical protein KNU04_gp52 [crAssphage sp. isolate ctbg_1]AXH74556.1 MAG: hypothetical protein [crAssphage sp. isolate ctbg_1]
MEFNFEVLDAIKKLNPSYICIVSNQRGIELGYINKLNFKCKFEYIERAIFDYTNIITFGNYCSSNIDKMNCKPNIGMLERSLYDINIRMLTIEYSKKDCLMIGDASGLEGQFSDTDKKTAENFGIDYLDVDEFVKQYN